MEYIPSITPWIRHWLGASDGKIWILFVLDLLLIWNLDIVVASPFSRETLTVDGKRLHETQLNTSCSGGSRISQRNRLFWPFSWIISPPLRSATVISFKSEGSSLALLWPKPVDVLWTEGICFTTRSANENLDLNLVFRHEPFSVRSGNIV